MRDDYSAFRARGAEIVCVAPHSLTETSRLAAELRLPFPVLADPGHRVFDAYGVHRRLLSLGQRPAVYVVDHNGRIRYAHVGRQQWEIPPSSRVLAVLDSLAGKVGPTQS